MVLTLISPSECYVTARGRRGERLKEGEDRPLHSQNNTHLFSSFKMIQPHPPPKNEKIYKTEREKKVTL